MPARRSDALDRFVNALTPSERRLWRGLTTPIKIQNFLDTIPYTGEERYRCPLTFLRDRTGHCFDGALFAAAALRAIGHPPLWVDLIPGDDDDHILAVFKRNGGWGAVANRRMGRRGQIELQRASLPRAGLSQPARTGDELL